MKPFLNKVLGVNAGQDAKAVLFGVGVVARSSLALINDSSSKRTDCVCFGLSPGLLRALLVVDVGHDGIGVMDVVAAKDNNVPAESEDSSQKSGSLEQNCVDSHPLQDSSKQDDLIMYSSDCTCWFSELSGVPGHRSWLQSELSVVLPSILPPASVVPQMQLTWSIPMSFGTV